MAAANAVRGHANANATRIHHPWTRRPGRIGFGTRSRSHTADRTRARTGGRYVRRLEMRARVDRYLRVHVVSQPEINKQLVYMSSS
jgi:hypothetical protein